MPKKPIDYANGLQYKIVCKDPAITDCYNGSCVSLKDRKYHHKSCCNNPNTENYNLKVYRFIRENGGWENWTFIQLELYPCNSKPELVLRERHWFDLLKPTLNTNTPMTTPDEKKKYMTEYYADKKGKFLAKATKYREEHSAEIVAYKKQHYTDNKAKILAKSQKYYTDNKAEIDAKQKEKVMCVCGCEVVKRTLNKHQKTKKHLHNMDEL